MYSLIFGGIAAVVGLLAAGFWFKASTVQVVSKTLGGCGSMMGGELVVRGTKGERLDFIETFVRGLSGLSRASRPQRRRRMRADHDALGNHLARRRHLHHEAAEA
jgi:hypothetical protein